MVAWQNHASELYDLDADPYELVNLYASAPHRATVIELEAELQAWLEQTGDTDFAAPVSEAFRERDKQKLQELMRRRARVNDAGN